MSTGDANLLKPSREVAREGLRLSLKEFYTVVEDWRATYPDADSSRILSVCKRMLPHMITLAEDMHEAKDIVDLMGILSEPRNLNPDAIVALVWKVLATLDVEDAARLQSAEREHGPAEQQPENRFSSEGNLKDNEHGTGAAPGKRRGRPMTIPIERKLRALNAGSNREKAEILYDTRFPSRRELKDVYPVMKNFKKSLPNSLEQPPDRPT